MHTSQHCRQILMLEWWNQQGNPPVVERPGRAQFANRKNALKVVSRKQEQNDYIVLPKLALDISYESLARRNAVSRN
jgi:hypothetical protein